jgi:site-specific recombinase XerD
MWGVTRPQASAARRLTPTTRGGKPKPSWRDRRIYAAPTKVTVGEQVEVHLRSATRGKEAATIRNYRDALRPVQERLGAVPLQKLTTARVEDLVDWMLSSGRKRGGKPSTGLSPRSVQLMLSRLRSLLDDAVHRRLIEFNVAAPVKCPAQVRTQREPWTEHEVRQFLASLTGHRLHATMLLALLGLRPQRCAACAGPTSTSTRKR